jgi:hypothetical protein
MKCASVVVRPGGSSGAMGIAKLSPLRLYIKHHINVVLYVPR